MHAVLGCWGRGRGGEGKGGCCGKDPQGRGQAQGVQKARSQDGTREADASSHLPFLPSPPALLRKTRGGKNEYSNIFKMTRSRSGPSQRLSPPPTPKCKAIRRRKKKGRSRGQAFPLQPQQRVHGLETCVDVLESLSEGNSSRCPGHSRPAGRRPTMVRGAEGEARVAVGGAGGGLLRGG